MARVGKPRKKGQRWEISYYDSDGKRRFETYSTKTQALQAQNKKKAEAQAIKAGLAKKPIEDHTFGELCEYWLEHHTAHKRSPKDDQSIIRRHLEPFLGLKLLREIRPQDGDRYRRNRAHLTAKTIHNHLTLFVTMLNCAVELGWLESAPRVNKPKLTEVKYRWLKTQDDIAALLRAAAQERPGVLELYTTAVYTGMRAGELLGLRWAEVDLDNRRISVERSYDKPPKNGLSRVVPILDPLLPVLREWKLVAVGDTVFPGATGTRQSPSARVLQEVLKRCLRRAGLVPTSDNKFAPYARITFHDLRHTFASHWVMHGGDVYRLQKVLGHKNIAMTERYAHLAPEAFKQDWGRLPDMVPRRDEGAVIPLER